jgi:hypothetical protein
LWKGASLQKKLKKRLIFQIIRANFMLNLKEQSKIANKKASPASEALSITNKIFK